MDIKDYFMKNLIAEWHGFIPSPKLTGKGLLHARHTTVHRIQQLPLEVTIFMLRTFLFPFLNNFVIYLKILNIYF